MDDNTYPNSPNSRSLSGSVNRSETNQSQSTTYEYDDDGNDNSNTSIPHSVSQIHRAPTNGSTYEYEDDDYMVEENNNETNINVFASSISSTIFPSVTTATSQPKSSLSSSSTTTSSIDMEQIGNVLALAQETFLHENLQGTSEAAIRLQMMAQQSSRATQNSASSNSLNTLLSSDLTSDKFYHSLSDLPDDQTIDYEVISSTADRSRNMGIGLVSTDSVTLWLKYKYFPIEIKFRTNISTNFLRVVAVNRIRFGNGEQNSNTSNESIPRSSSPSDRVDTHSSSSSSSSSFSSSSSPKPFLLPPSHEYEIALYRHIQRVMDLLSLPDNKALLKDLLERFTYRSESSNKVKPKDTVMERTRSANHQDLLEFFSSTGIDQLLTKRYSAARKILEGIRIAYKMLFTHCFVCGRILPDVRTASTLTLAYRIPTTSTCGNDLCRHSEMLSTRFVDLYTESRNTKFFFHYDFMVQAAMAALQSNKRDALMHPVPDAYVSDTKIIDHTSLTNDILFLLQQSRAEHISACTSNAAIRLYFMTLTLRQAKIPDTIIIKAIQDIAQSHDDPLTHLPHIDDEYTRDTTSTTTTNNTTPNTASTAPETAVTTTSTTLKADKLYLLAWWLLRSLPLRLALRTPDQLPFIARRDKTFLPYVSLAQKEADTKLAPWYTCPNDMHAVPLYNSQSTDSNVCPYQFLRIFTQSGLPAYISVAEDGDSRTVLPSVMEDEEEAEQTMLNYLPNSPNLPTNTLTSRSYVTSGQSYTPVDYVRTVYHGSNIQTWLSILRVGLLALSNTEFMKVGAAYGPGVYFGPTASTSLAYCNYGGNNTTLSLVASQPLLVVSSDNGLSSKVGTVVTVNNTNATTTNNASTLNIRGGVASRGGSNALRGTARPNSATVRNPVTSVVRNEAIVVPTILPELVPILQPVSLTPVAYYALGIAHVDGRCRGTTSNTSSSSSSSTTGSTTKTPDAQYPIKNFGYCITSIEDNRNRLLYLVLPNSKNQSDPNRY